MTERMRFLWAWHVQTRLMRQGERLVMWVAWHLPKSLVMWCYVRVGAYATMGQYGDTEVSELTMMDALKRWKSA